MGRKVAASDHCKTGMNGVLPPEIPNNRRQPGLIFVFIFVVSRHVPHSQWQAAPAMTGAVDFAPSQQNQWIFRSEVAHCRKNRK